MDQAQSLFFTLLRSGLWGTVPDVSSFRPSAEDWKDVLRIAKEGPEVGMRMILSTRRPAQEMKALLEHFPTRMVFRVSDRKDSKMLLKSEAAFWELNGNGEMVLYDKGIISQCNITSFIQ